MADSSAFSFCEDFLSAPVERRAVMGTSVYAQSVNRFADVALFIDDFSREKTFLGKPVLRTDEVRKDVLVVSAVVGISPLTAQRKLAEAGLRSLDYFSFAKYAKADLLPVYSWPECVEDFERHVDKYVELERRLADDESLSTFRRLMNFRRASELRYLEGFEVCTSRQYFEDFLELETAGEIFVDAGSYDGATTLEFVRRCPRYDALYAFEPEPASFQKVQETLRGLPKTLILESGLHSSVAEVRFSPQGSSSSIVDSGTLGILVTTLDAVLEGSRATFIKMDIEGAECAALLGAAQTIRDHHPRLAICVYHLAEDLWRVPEIVLAIRNDYDIFLRHYTEGATETVMFFMPRSGTGGRFERTPTPSAEEATWSKLPPLGS